MRTLIRGAVALVYSVAAVFVVALWTKVCASIVQFVWGLW